MKTNVLVVFCAAPLIHTGIGSDTISGIFYERKEYLDWYNKNCPGTFDKSAIPSSGGVSCDVLGKKECKKVSKCSFEDGGCLDKECEDFTTKDACENAKCFWNKLQPYSFGEDYFYFVDDQRNAGSNSVHCFPIGKGNILHGIFSPDELLCDQSSDSEEEKRKCDSAKCCGRINSKRTCQKKGCLYGNFGLEHSFCAFPGNNMSPTNDKLECPTTKNEKKCKKNNRCHIVAGTCQLESIFPSFGDNDSIPENLSIPGSITFQTGSCMINNLCEVCASDRKKKLCKSDFSFCTLRENTCLDNLVPPGIRIDLCSNRECSIKAGCFRDEEGTCQDLNQLLEDHSAGYGNALDTVVKSLSCSASWTEREEEHHTWETCVGQEKIKFKKNLAKALKTVDSFKEFKNLLQVPKCKFEDGICQLK